MHQESQSWGATKKDRRIPGLTGQSVWPNLASSHFSCHKKIRWFEWEMAPYTQVSERLISWWNIWGGSWKLQEMWPCWKQVAGGWLWEFRVSSHFQFVSLFLEHAWRGELSASCSICLLPCLACHDGLIPLSWKSNKFLLLYYSNRKVTNTKIKWRKEWTRHPTSTSGLYRNLEKWANTHSRIQHIAYSICMCLIHTYIHTCMCKHTQKGKKRKEKQTWCAKARGSKVRGSETLSQKFVLHRLTHFTKNKNCSHLVSDNLLWPNEHR